VNSAICPPDNLVIESVAIVGSLLSIPQTRVLILGRDTHWEEVYPVTDVNDMTLAFLILLEEELPSSEGPLNDTTGITFREGEKPVRQRSRYLDLPEVQPLLED
jgi:hypothetical protein